MFAATMSRRALLMGGAGALIATGLCAGARAQPSALKIGFVYVGPVGDHGWSHQHDIGRKAIEAAHGARVETTFVENVAEGPDAERVIAQLARTGHRLIFTTSFGFMNPTEAVARRFPNVVFEHATGHKRLPNLATYDARFYEGRFILGQIAARTSRSGTMGYVAAFPIPEVVQGINAYMLGAQSVRRDIKCRIVWVNSWYDPGKEADAAKALFDLGADVIAQHTDSPAPIQVAEQRGLKGFGQASDMARFAPNAQLTAIVYDWAPYYVARAQAVLDGRWTSSAVWGGLDTGMVKLSDLANMPLEVSAMARATEERIKAKQFHPFSGEIVDQAGTRRNAAGETMSDDDISKMNWFVRGIEDRFPA